MSKLTKYSELKHGMRVTCKIKDIQINDAKLSINKDGNVYICQNKLSRYNAENKLGYKYSWWVANYNKNLENWNTYVTDLESVEEVENRKIKSIKVKKDYKFSLWDMNLEDLIKKNPEAFEIEYEPILLKRPDGSLISEPEEGAKVWIFVLNYVNEGKDEEVVLSLKPYESIHLRHLLKEGNVFLQEDENLAEKKKNMINKQLEIQFEIDRLNAEGGNEDLDYLFYLHPTKKEVNATNRLSFEYYTNAKSSVSQKTAEIILEKYTQDELKQYLGIII